jgi:hypothetical protein
MESAYFDTGISHISPSDFVAKSGHLEGDRPTGKCRPIVLKKSQSNIQLQRLRQKQIRQTKKSPA